MRVLAVTERASLQGGADRYVHELVRATSECEPRVEWHALYGYADATAAPLAGAFATRRRLRALERRVPHRGEERAAAELTSIIREGGFDAVLVQNVMSPVLLGALADRPEATLVVQDHRVFCPARGKVFPDGSPCNVPMGPACDACFLDESGRLDVERRDMRLQLTEARLSHVRRFRRVVALSRYVRRELALAGIEASRMEVVPPPVSAWVAVCARAERRGEGIVVPGRISWHKGSVHLLEALHAAGIRERVTLAGSGPGEADVRAAAVRLCLESRVHVTGWLDDATLARVLLGSAVVVLPSLWAEPFGIAGLEACALGLPVVAHAVGGIPEWLEHERTGLLVPPGDRRQLAAAIDRVLRDDALATRLGADACQHALAWHGGTVFADRWRALLSRAARETR